MNDMETNYRLVQTIISANSFCRAPHFLLNKYGPCAGVMYSELVGLQNYYDSKAGSLYNWFFFTIDYAKHKTGMSRYSQTTSIDTLIKEGLIEMKVAGMPAKRYFRISPNSCEKLIKLIQEYDGLATLIPEDSDSDAQIVGIQQTSAEYRNHVCGTSANKVVGIQQTGLLESSNNKNIYKTKDKETNEKSIYLLSPDGNDTMVDALAMVQSFLGRADSSDDPTASF